MNDLTIAKNKLESGEYSLVLCKGESIIKSSKSGVAPLIEVMSKNINIKNYSAADKIVGKASALLLVHAGIKEVYGAVMSKKGAEVLEIYNIYFEFGQLVENIINQQGTGMCPMEIAVSDISDPSLALNVLQSAIKSLRKI